MTSDYTKHIKNFEMWESAPWIHFETLTFVLVMFQWNRSSFTISPTWISLNSKGNSKHRKESRKLFQVMKSLNHREKATFATGYHGRRRLLCTCIQQARCLLRLARRKVPKKKLTGKESIYIHIPYTPPGEVRKIIDFKHSLPAGRGNIWLDSREGISESLQLQIYNILNTSFFRGQHMTIELNELNSFSGDRLYKLIFFWSPGVRFLCWRVTEPSNTTKGVIHGSDAQGDSSC